MANEKIADCPLCLGEVVETQKGYGCANWKEENGGCKFVIWKNFYDKQITRAQAKALIEQGKTSTIKGWVSRKTGKPFDAALKLEKGEDGAFRVSFAFEDKK